MMAFDSNLLPDLLSIYYSRFFPNNIFCRWLSCGNSPHPLSHRELSFTLADDVYIRYLSISNQKELIALFQKKCPYKIDIGGVYDSKPSMSKHSSVVLARELVFDIDLTDYDDIRTCCQGADVCEKCWKFMVVACQILEASLKEDFGFSSVLWVYSGRRGVHCWVSSYEARCLTSAERSALTDYLSLLSGGDLQAKKVHLNTDNIHSSIKRAVKICSSLFDEILSDQQFISTPEGVAKFLRLIPDDSLAGQVQKAFEGLPADSGVRWKTFQQVYLTFWKEHSGNRKIKHLVEEIQLQWCYPRLDVNVTKGSNHLLKAPFSIHPKTGRVCVVFRAVNVAKFSTVTVPQIGDLMDDQAPDHVQAKTLMQESVAAFQDHVWALEKEEAKRKRMAVVNLWWIPFLVPSKQDELCGIFNTRTIYLQLGENGSINHRNQTWNNKNLSRCSMELVTCPSCSIQISIVHMDLPQLCIESSYVNASSEQCPCSALTVWEPSGHSPPAHLCLLTNTSVFTSSTRSVGVSFDLAPQNWTGSFFITFISQRNQNFVSGKIGQEGVLTSPDFPSLYPRDFGVEHVISCTQEDCIIFLIFVDFLISPSSIMEFYNSDGKPIQLVSGLIARPKPVVSTGPSLIIRFFGNGGTSMGYKALYYFVNRNTWLSSVNSDCGGEVDNLGGTIYMTGIQGYYDCIWIIQPAAAISHFKTHIYLKVVEYPEGELLIQHGLTSESRIIEEFGDDHHHQPVEHVTPISKGFYISFRGTLASESKLVIVYSAFAYMDCLSGVDLLCGNKRCISIQLMCDSFDNCGDDSDETGDCKSDEVDKNPSRYWWPVRSTGGGSGQGTSGALLSLGAALAGSALLLAAGMCRMVLRVRSPPSSHATHHMDHARTIAHLLNIAELDERDDPPTYEPPPEYNQVVKPAHPRRKHSTQRLIDRDSSSQLQYGEESTPSSSLAAEMKKQFVNLPAERIPEVMSSASLRVPDFSPPVSLEPTGHNTLVIIPETAPTVSLEPTSYNTLVRIPDNSPPVSLETTGYNEQDLGLSLTLSTSSHKAGNKDSNLMWLASTPNKPASGPASATNISAVSFDTLYSNSGQDLTIPPPRLIKSQSQDNILWLRSEFAKNVMQEPLASNFCSFAGDPAMGNEAEKDYKRSSYSQRSLDDNIFEYSSPSSGFRNEPSCSTTENANG